MQLNRKTDHALRLLMLTASVAPEPMKLADIAWRWDISHANLKKIAAELTDRGWLEAIRGRNGGVLFAEDAGAVTVGDVIRLFEPLELADCFKDDGECPATGNCLLQRALHDARSSFLRSLDEWTLDQLVNDNGRLLNALGLGRQGERADGRPRA